MLQGGRASFHIELIHLDSQHCQDMLSCQCLNHLKDASKLFGSVGTHSFTKSCSGQTGSPARVWVGTLPPLYRNARMILLGVRSTLNIALFTLFNLHYVSVTTTLFTSRYCLPYLNGLKASDRWKGSHRGAVGRVGWAYSSLYRLPEHLLSDTAGWYHYELFVFR